MEKFQYFKGDGSFIRNYYAIFPQGLDKDLPNTNAVNRGYEAGGSLLGKVSYHGNSSFSKLIHYLEIIQEREKNKEQRFISNKLNRLKEILPKEYYLKIEQLLTSENYSAAYTLLQNYHKDLSDLRAELSNKNFRSFQKTKEFWKTDFAKYLGEELKKHLQFQGNKVIATGSGTSIENLVDNFFKTLGLNENVLSNGYEKIRDEYIKELKEALQKRNIISENWDVSRNLFNSKDNIDWSNIAKGIKKNKNGKTKSIRVAGEDIGEGIKRGIGMELQAAINAKRTGSTVIHSGRITREVLDLLKAKDYGEVAQKGDIITFDIFNANYDLNGIIKNLLKDNSDLDLNLELLRQQITKILPELEIFEVSENIKGYKSNYNLSIEEEGDFKNRLANLKKIENNNAFFEKLVFILINTTKRCLFNNKTDEIGHYVAASFAAWMWDDYAEIYNLNNGSSNFTKIHIFNSGGAYFTASTLMRATIDELKNNYGEDGFVKNNKTSLVKVNIKPGSFSNSEYRQLKEDIKIISMATAQSDLKKRWDYVRARALERGKMSISIKQKELERLLGNLKEIIMKT